MRPILIQTVIVRTPAATVAEMVISDGNAVTVYALSFAQLRLLARQSTDAALRWPVREATFDEQQGLGT